jgi:ribosomal protein S18 acetylase RimI-like enzyme
VRSSSNANVRRDGLAVTTNHRRIRLAAPADIPRLQRLLDRCSDHYELHEGRPTPHDAAEQEFHAVPEGWSPEASRILALENDGGELDAMLQLLEDYPEQGTWWIGTLVVAPELRGQGLGAMLLRHGCDAALAEGASAMQLVVSVANPRGQRFWEAAGFRDAGRSSTVTHRNGHVDVVRVMTRRT